MDENKLANVYLKAITKYTDEHPNMWQTQCWELASILAKLAQPRKRYQTLYNSPEGRMERVKLSKKTK